MRPTPPATGRAGPSRGRGPGAVGDARWVEALRWTALAVFAGLTACGVLFPDLAGRLVWTVGIALLPLFFVVVGYHRWRRICPLAFVAQLPSIAGWAGRRRAGPWLQAHAYHVVFGIFVASLWLRLVATNGDGPLLAAFLLAISAAALLTGFIYTGKTWCNYFCPVSFVEKLYTEPRGLYPTPNSQCATCTACRPACPDINQENSYWKDILSPARRDAFYAFPGLVLAFYGFYFLQSGTWAYYFDGGWTAEPGVVRTAFLPGSDALTAGFYFWPEVPRALAAAITLALGGALSAVLLRLLERQLAPALRARNLVSNDAGARSVLFALAAFAGFISFYSFAGAPTLRLVPGLANVFLVTVVVVATLSLRRRISRRPETFAEETLARRILADWPWDDTPPPRDLREAYLIHTLKSRSSQEAREQLLVLYRTAVRDALESGVVSRADVHRLEALRDELHISESDHERVMRELAEERRAEGREDLAESPEKLLQLESYAEALAIHLERRSADGAALDDAFIRRLCDQYEVTPEEHARALDRLLLDREGVAASIADAPAVIEASAVSAGRLEGLQSPMAAFLAGLLVRQWRRASGHLLQIVSGHGEANDQLRSALMSHDPRSRESAMASLAEHLSPATAGRLAASRDMARDRLDACRSAADLLRLHLTSADAHVRAAAFYLLESADAATEADRRVLADDEHPVVRDTVSRFQTIRDGEAMSESSLLEKMVSLSSIGLLGDLEPEDLTRLAEASHEVWFRQGETLCREGEVDDNVFVLLDGEVSITRTIDGAERQVAVDGPGSSIGEMAVLDPAPRSATVAASTVAVRALRLSGGAFRAALQTSPVLTESIIRLLVRRLRAGSRTDES